MTSFHMVYMSPEWRLEVLEVLNVLGVAAVLPLVVVLGYNHKRPKGNLKEKKKH